MEQVILEANRLRSIEQNQDKKLDEFNNRWTNSVSTTGIEVRAGDIISVESAAINAKGNEVEDTMEFRGITDAGFKDNEVDLTYSYYVNHTGDMTIPLPLRADLTYNGYNSSNTHEENYEGQNYVNLRTRQLGEWSPENVPLEGISNVPRPINYTTNPQFYFFLPNPLIVQEYGNYEDGGIYDTYFMDGANHQITGIKIQVNTTRTEGNTDGIIDTWEIHSIDANEFWDQNWSWDRFNAVADSNRYYITNPTHQFSPNQNTSFGIIWKNPKTFAQRIDMRPDGKRYYKGRTDFIGFGLTNFGGVYDGITEAPNIPQIGLPRDLKFPAGFENINWGKATTTTKLNVPTGFATPTDVAGILTDQLHSPQEITRENEVGEFVNLEYYDYKNYTDIVNQKIPNQPPPLITTPTFKPITAGFSTFTQNPPVNNIKEENLGQQIATYQDQYRIWYNSVYWEEPDRIEALSIFKQFYYGADNTDPKNEINSGQDQQPNTGDFKNQTIGKLGLIPRMLNNWESTNAPTNRNLPDFVIASTNSQRFYPIRTNIKYTKATVERIAKSFRMIEKNRNTDNGLPTTAGGKLPTTPINAGEIITANMAVKLDIGMYVDEYSQAGLIPEQVRRPYIGATTTGTIVEPPIEGLEGFFDLYPSNKRNKFRASSEVQTQQYLYITTSTRTTTIGTAGLGYNTTMNADTWRMTDGQELPQIWVQSRWRDGLTARQMSPDADPNKPQLSVAIEDLMDDNQNADDMPYPNGYSVEDLQERFERSWTDPETGEVYAYADYVKWAIDADVALLPYFAQTGDGTWGDVPYIAFLTFDRLGNNNNFVFNPFPTRPFGIAHGSMPYGEFFGFDCSYTRNKAVFFQNTQKYEEMKASDYAYGSGISQLQEIEPSPLAMIGASNVVVNFDAIKSRFEVKGLHTPFTIGNPFLNTPFSTKVATDNPEQVIYSIGRVGCNYFVYTKPPDPTIGGYPFGEAIGTSIDGYNNHQDKSSIIDAYSGIAIESLTLTKPTGETQLIGEYNDLNAFFFNNSLLNKMGFELQQILPPVGDVQARFDNALFTDPLTSPYDAEYTRAVKPLTTSAYISSAEYQPAATDFNRFPLYNLGTAQDIQAEPSVVSGSLLAKNLPSKLDFPYLMVYSNLGNEMLYYGGSDAHSRLPCLAYISRNYSAGDFFYMPAGSFNLTASKDFVLTDITTDIRLPDGSRPRLSPHSSVIYKLIRQQPQQPVAPVVGNEPKGNKAKLLNM